MAKTQEYQERFYRDWPNRNDLLAQEVVVRETDLFIFSEIDVREKALELVNKYRQEIEEYIKKRPEFQKSLIPVKADSDSTGIIKEMIKASDLAGVGPMAAVAGAIAEFTGKELAVFSRQVIIENGGDIFLKSTIPRTVSIFAGDSPLSNKLFIKIKPKDTPVGICTSSGTIGHSLSFGKADACVIIAKTATLADAVATAACNRIKTKDDIKAALKFAYSIKGVHGAIAIFGNEFGSIGDIELV
jgi:ApbE superfamily uncharacterized protein (UPF0280 family)